jgi:sortase A
MILAANTLRGRTSRPLRRRLAVVLGCVIMLIGGASIAQSVYMSGKAALAQILLQRAWTKTLDGETSVKPWNWADTWPVAKISVPRLDRSRIVLSGFSGQVLAFAPGLLEQGAVPGQPGMAVIAAHRDTHFKFLKNIEIGDRVDITSADGVTTVFEITETQIVQASSSGLVTDGQTPRIALVTCFPFDAVVQGDQRFVAIGEIVPDSETEENKRWLRE